MTKLPILSRRTVLVGTGLAFAPSLPAFAAGLVATPSQTEGPFYPTGFPADMDNDLVQVRGQAAKAMGQVLHLQGRVIDLERRHAQRRDDRDLAMRCAGPLRPSAPARPRPARRGVPGLWPHAGRCRGPLQLPHPEARGLSRPHAAHPSQGGDRRRTDAHQPVLPRGRSPERARRRLQESHQCSRPARTASR